MHDADIISSAFAADCGEMEVPVPAEAAPTHIVKEGCGILKTVKNG